MCSISIFAPSRKQAGLRHLKGFVAALPAACAAVAMPGAAKAADPPKYNFFTYDNPADLTFNQLLGINNGGLISGYYGSGVAGHPNQGYLFFPPGGYIAENYPGSVQTQVTGLNDVGTTVGFWSNTNNGPPNDSNFGFYSSLGVFHNVNNPSTPTTGVTTNQLLGVNDSNIAVGFYNDAAGNSHGYTYNIATHTFSADIEAPGATSTTTAAINNFKEIAGFDVVGGVTEAFTDKSGTFTQYTVPGATSTSFFGLNDNGIAVGDYVDAAGSNGLVYNTNNGTWFTLNAPLASFANGGTTLNGINDHGWIVGFYGDSAANTDGLLAIPGMAIPEASTWAMALAGFALLGYAGYRRHRSAVAAVL